jgi:type I restriction enzyme S subunit
MNAQQLRNSILQSLIQPQDGWKEVLLKDIVDEHCPISYGIVQQGEHVENGVPVVRPVDLHRQYVTRTGLKCTTQVISNSYSRTVLRGDEILLCVRGTTGIMSLATDEIKGCNVNRGIVPLYFKKDYDRAFVYYQMQSPVIQEIFSEKTTGSALKQLNIKDLRIVKLFFPPLAEQRRIVAKIEELMPLVERYGKAQQALDQLNESLPARLRQSILQEAIQGRLVPQDPKEEPASELLKRIRKEKEQLVKEKVLKAKDASVTPLQPEEISCPIPEGWAFVRLKDVCQLSDGEKQTGSQICMDAKYLRGKKTGDILESGKFVKKGDNIILVDGENSGEVFTAPIDGYMGSTFKKLWVSSELYLPYILNIIRSYKETLRNSKKGAAIPHLNKDIFYNIEVGIPPLSEQKRIVAKVEELFGVIKK